MRIWNKEIISKVGEEVELFGWVNVRRDHGKIIFIDLRDRTGINQVVFTPQCKDYKLAEALRSEWVIKLLGIVKERPKGMINEDLPTGKYEIEATGLEVLSIAKTPPFEITTDGYEVDEELRRKYRYLDLRRDRLQKNLRLRNKVTALVREYFARNDFVEIETPNLTKTSPEGARDFLVPSRFYPGKFYALPQAPQQYKQLLMIAGFERYFQIAHVFRDEDLRADRQLEHTQIDLEMSFATEEEVRDMVEGMMIYVAESCGKKIWKKPFPVFTHEEAMKKFGADKFDLRENKKDGDVLAFAWVIDFPLFEKTDEGGWTFAHNPFSAPKAEAVEKVMKEEDLGSLRAQQYDLVCNGYEMASGGVRISNPVVQRKIFEIMGLTLDQIEERFGHIINAYEYGAPPHAGMAPGLDRLIMLLAGEENIREVIAFPVSAKGQTSVMDSPSPASPQQLKELHIKITEDKK
ncbi:MAG: aspartate--tRNA ligase [Candidatus Wolfebacteria bacterium]|nr:aspartate--tRNA ligase [Candidatus Wolfebacteria bacterium]